MNLFSTKFQTDGSFAEPRMNGYDLFTSKDVTNYNPSVAWAAGAISSDLKDASKFLKYAIEKNVLLDKNATAQQRKWKFGNTVNFGLPLFYGFLLIKLGSFIGHFGSILGYNTVMMYEPCTDTTLVIAVNVDFNKQGIAPADFIAQYIIAKLNNKARLSDAEDVISGKEPYRPTV